MLILEQPSSPPSLLPCPYTIVGVFNGLITWNISFSKYVTEVHRCLPTGNTLKLQLQIIPVKIADFYDPWGISYFNLKPSEMVQFVEMMGECLLLAVFVFKGKSISVLANSNFPRVMRL